jgi:hypothetical protein
MDPRVVRTLAWFDEKQDDVAAHTGAASAELQILRLIAAGVIEPGLGYLGWAYRESLKTWSPTLSDRSSVYVLTHAVMFGTDFGRIALDGEHEEIAHFITEAIGYYADDTDCLGELLICARCLNMTGLLAAQMAFDRQWEALDRENFQQNYHPILVGAILYALG